MEVKKPGSEVPRAISEILLDVEAKQSLKPTSSFSTGPSIPTAALPCSGTESGAGTLQERGECRQSCRATEGQVSTRYTHGHPPTGPRGNSGYSHFPDRLCTCWHHSTSPWQSLCSNPGSDVAGLPLPGYAAQGPWRNHLPSLIHSGV